MQKLSLCDKISHALFPDNKNVLERAVLKINIV